MLAGRSRRRRKAAARAAAAAAASTLYDIGNGVSVPEGDWLVPMKGETSLTVELEMPGWPQADMVQVGSRVVLVAAAAGGGDKGTVAAAVQQDCWSGGCQVAVRLVSCR